ncbi:MAG: GIY-YIG nuclease family protein [Anaerolineales bacterium]|nr:GIY-YIG nuclease family protein [Anaerolineales bacterium]
MKKYYVYILNSPTGTIYTGMTNDLEKRVYQHKNKLIEGFTKKYNVTRLAYFEETTDVNAAIAREKEIKGWRRSKKLALIKSLNPTWRDLAEDWFDDSGS